MLIGVRSLPRIAAVWYTLCCFCGVCHGAAAIRETTSLDAGWRFYLGEVSGGEEPLLDDAAWRAVDVPHDWSVEAEYSPENVAENSWLPGGIAWYRRSFVVPPGWMGRNVLLRFDGVYMDSQVWLNGEQVGGRPYGFISFDCDLSGKLREGRNVIAVRVNNTPAPTARFYHGGGIYGHVRLLVLPAIHIVPNGGVFVKTISANESRAELSLVTEVENRTMRASPVAVVHQLRRSDGAIVAKWETPRVQVAPGQRTTVEVDGSVASPQLWSPDSPHLYELVSALREGEADVDEVRTRIGIRTTRWDAATGFWLNDRNLKIRGVCEHWEMMPVGAAVPDALLERRLRHLQSMGVNAIRTAHNPFPPVFYDLCDRLGLLVMDEIFDGWHKKGANDYGERFFTEWWRQDVADWVRRDRNHPSIIIYSIGNETGHADVHGITPEIRRHDPTRPTTGGMITEGVDVMGFNGPGEITKNLEAARATHPGLPIILTEVPHTVQTRGFYRTLSWWRDAGNEREEYRPYASTEFFTDGGHPRYNSSYDNATVRITARQSLVRTESTPWIAGEFRWTGYECFGEAHFMGREFPKRTYNAGVIDLAGLPKDHFYLYQSRWTETPMVHLLPHWTHPGREGQTVPVVAYSNCDEAELFLNGQSLGRQRRSVLLDFVWPVAYAAGEIKAIGYRAGLPVASAVHFTAGSPARIDLATDNATLAVDRGDVALVTFRIVDEAGRMVPWAHDELTFRTIGPVRTLGFENGDPMDGTASKAPVRKAFYGLGRGFFQANGEDGAVEVFAAGILGQREFADHARIAITTSRIALRGELPDTQLDIFYTVDGSAPSPESARYVAPFVVKTDTQIRVLVRRDGVDYLTFNDRFRPGEPRRWVDQRYGSGSVAAKLAHATDPMLVGLWKAASDVFEFRNDGTLWRTGNGVGEEVGRWSCLRTTDAFEEGGVVARGEIHWKNGKREPLRVMAERPTEFVTGTGAVPVRFERVTGN